MSKEQIIVLINRYLRGFVAGGIASVAALLVAGVSISSLEDLRKLSIAVVIAFVTGGLLAIDKYLRFEPEA